MPSALAAILMLAATASSPAVMPSPAEAPAAAPSPTDANSNSSANGAALPEAQVGDRRTPPTPKLPTELGFKLFPADPRPLQPVLQQVDRSWTATQQGALIPSDPLSDAAAWIKQELAALGFRYALFQAFTLAAMSDREAGDGALAAYSLRLYANLEIFESDDLGGTAGWISLEVQGGTGLGFDWESQQPQRNIGALTPLNGAYFPSEIAVNELAWSQAFAAGQFVATLGLLDQTAYLDTNRYANSQFGQLLNQAFVNSMVVPMPQNDLGFNLQWQPVDWFYAMFGISTTNWPVGATAWDDISSDNMALLWELGFVGKDVGGLGPGTLRLQPFWARIDGDAGAGMAVNFEQQLGAQSPLGAFGRIGFGDEVTAQVGGAEAQAAVGLALLSPFAPTSPSPLWSTGNNGYAALGFVWSRFPELQGLRRRDEYAVELTWAIQLTPTATLQPDLQLVWNRARSDSSDPALVFQLQLNLQW